MSAETVGDDETTKEGTMDDIVEKTADALRELGQSDLVEKAHAEKTDAELIEEDRVRREEKEAKEKAEREADFNALNASVDAINVDIEKRNGMIRTRIELRREYSLILLELEHDRTQARFEHALQMTHKVAAFDLELHDLEASIVHQVEEYEKQRKAYEDKWERLAPWMMGWLGYATLGAIGLWGLIQKKKAR